MIIDAFLKSVIAYYLYFAVAGTVLEVSIEMGF